VLYHKVVTKTIKSYTINWGRLHGSNYAIVFYYKSYFNPTNGQTNVSQKYGVEVSHWLVVISAIQNKTNDKEHCE